jgi:class 3 adenylate cyclase
MVARRPVTDTFLFVDLTGASASFDAEIRGVLHTYGAELIEAFDHGLTIRVPRVEDALRLALGIAGEAIGRQDSAPVRVGLHTGPAIVNLAERVAELAAAGEVLVTDATRSAAAAEPGVVDFLEFVPRGSRRLRNVRPPVELWAAVPLR